MYMYIVFPFISLLYVTNHVMCSFIVNRYPTSSDIIEASVLAENITNPTWRYIVERQLLYCPLEPVCNNLTRSDFTDNGMFISCCSGHSWNTVADTGDQCSNDMTFTLDEDGHNISCILPQYIPYGKTEMNVQNAYVMISKCDDHYKDQNIIDQCNLDDGFVDKFGVFLPLFVPLSTANNGSVYKNRFCAICNHITEEEIVDWYIRIICSEGSPFVSPPSTLTDLLLQIQDANVCNIIFSNSATQVTECEKIIYTSCNQTGRWETYDAIIEQGCNSYTSRYLKRYKNVFCYMCNEVHQPFMGCRELDFNIGTSGPRFGQFTALIQYRNPVQDSAVQHCSDQEFYDYYMDSCHKVYCPDFYSYNRTDSSCVSMFTTMSNIMYEVYYKVNIPTRLRCHFNAFNNLLDSIRNAIIDTMTSHLHTLANCYTQDTFWYIPRFNESSSVEYFIVEFNFPMILSHDHKQYIDVYMSLSTLNVSLDKVYYTVDLELLPAVKVEEDVSLELYQYFQIPISNNKSPPCQMFRTTTVFVVKGYFNPMIQLSIDEVRTMKGKVEILDSFDNIVNRTNQILIDLTQYVNARRGMTKDKPWQSDIIEEILSAVCSFISIASLILTLIVYLLFTELQTIPGIITMILCGNLILAHALYMFGLNATGNEIICVLIGLLIHFLWVSSIMWMHICTIHMFQVFYFMEQRHSEKKSKKIIVLYLCYALLVSFICVCINVTMYFLKPEDDVGYLGYGGRYCYISKPYMVLFSFALPVGLLLLSNVVLFLIVVFKIENLPEVNSDNIKNQSRNSFVIYAKLTCLTGVSWVFGFLYQWTLIKAFSYIFIILTASQGLFIFLSYGCSNRARRFCISLFNQRKSLKTSAPEILTTKL